MTLFNRKVLASKQSPPPFSVKNRNPWFSSCRLNPPNPNPLKVEQGAFSQSRIHQIVPYIPISYLRSSMEWRRKRKESEPER